ncbi:unnamed protein product [Adineta ricciae]|uniref:Alpha-type protein kinase domain-containing protein n=2 Tax=Adineta ricciae TaxID=249248 RepID=A0A816D4I6_ADIRI|nr:unnamed protein product [Adineta ricciae]
MERSRSTGRRALSNIAALRRQLDAIERIEKKNLNEINRLNQIQKQCDLLQKETVSNSSIISQKQHEVQKYKEHLVKRTSEIHDIIKELNKTQSVDVCFLIDCTSSMQKYIDEVKDRIFETIRLLKSRFPHLNIRLAFVGYRDVDLHPDKQFSVSDFTNEQDFYSFLSTIKCEKGGDACEDVLGGLSKLIELNWKQPLRVVMHIADCPSHGRRYHNLADICDDFIKNDNDGLVGYNCIKQLIDLQIMYFFGRLTHHTDKMIEQFTNYSQNRMTIEQIRLENAENLLPFAVHIVSQSIAKATATVLKHYSLNKENPLTTHSTNKSQNQREIILDKKQPDWSNILIKKVQFLKYECNDRLRCEQTTQTGNIKINRNPFAQGAMRLAYYGLVLYKDRWEKVVFKQYKCLDNCVNIKDKYLELLDCQTIADYLAQEFNKISFLLNVTLIVKKIKFVTTILVFDPPNEGKYHFFTMERFIDGSYKKFSNNVGYVNYDDPAVTLQAFSHWTYERTNGNMIVVDLQGIDIGDNQTYLLTDPCIHSTDLTRFGRTNLGKQGIKRFFQTHICNSICQALKLKRHKDQPDI